MMAKRFRWGIFLLLILVTLGGGTAIGMLTDPAAAYGEFIQPPLSGSCGHLGGRQRRIRGSKTECSAMVWGESSPQLFLDACIFWP